MKYVLAVDLGTGGPKVAIVSTQGDVIAHTVRTNRLVLIDGGGVEQDPEEWWSSIADALRDLVGRNVVPADDIVAISVTAQWMVTIPIDAKGNPLSNAISWMDDRGARYAKRVSSGGVTIPGVGLQRAQTAAVDPRHGRRAVPHGQGPRGPHPLPEEP